MRENTSASLCYVALGANLGEREAQLCLALDGLWEEPRVDVLRASSIFETAAVGPPQPEYLNAVVEIATELPAGELLQRLLALEDRAGRVRTGEKDGPRTLDCDLLLYGGECIEAEDLSVPHPRMHERGFVLEPLCELAPQLCHPRLGAQMEELRETAHQEGAVRRVAHGRRLLVMRLESKRVFAR